MSGKQLRINRLLRNGKMLCVPLDHGITISDIGHLAAFKETVKIIVENGASSIIVHKGMVRFLPELNNAGLIIHLSASTENSVPVRKVIVCEVEEAIALGADAVSVHINLGNNFEKEMLSDLARVSRDCVRYGIPLFAMMYIRNDKGDDIKDDEIERVVEGNIVKVKKIELEKHSIRIASELGADIVKIGANWDSDKLQSIIKDALIPVVVAGGDILDPKKFCLHTAKLMKSGILGVSFGRNIFMSNNPKATMENLSKIVLGNT